MTRWFRRRIVLLLTVVAAALSGFPFATVHYSDPSAPPPAPPEQGPLPVVFEPNQGQFDGGYRFLARAAGYQAFLAPAEAALVLDSVLDAEGRPIGERGVARIRLEDADPAAAMEALDPAGGEVNYLLGDDPAAWRTGIPTYGRVVAYAVYPGVDVVWYSRDGLIQYDFVVGPGVDPAVIGIGFDGAERVAVADTGDLVVGVGGGEMRQSAPVLYQEGPEGRETVDGRFVVTGADRVGFEVGAYDPARPLVIDPVLVYSTYLGGGGDDAAHAVAVDGDGHAYVAGEADSATFPNTSIGLPDAFVAKFSPDGDTILSLSFFGGSGTETAQGVDVDRKGQVYVAGYTDSNDFPTEDPSQPGLKGGNDAFVVKLDEDLGGFEYSTFLGGDGTDIALDVAVKGESAYVTGYTASDNFPKSNELAALSGPNDAFVTKFDDSGERDFSIFLGGSGIDTGYGIAVDDGHAYVGGVTTSTNFPTTDDAFEEDAPGGVDGFVVKLEEDASDIAYGTYLGGAAGLDWVLDVDVHDGSAYVTGYTQSSDFPDEGAIQGTLDGPTDAFVTQLTPDGDALEYSTFLGGANEDIGWAVAVDRRGNAYVAGQTDSGDFLLPATPTLQGTLRGGDDAFVAKVNTGGDQLEFATYLGGTGDDVAFGIDAGPGGNAFVVGQTSSDDFPLNGPLQDDRMSGPLDGFVARIDG